MAEFIIIGSLVAVVVIAAATVFGEGVYCQYHEASFEVDSRSQLPPECVARLASRDTGSQDPTNNPTQATGDPTTTTPTPPPPYEPNPPPPPPPPVPIAPGTDRVRHHVGDGLCSPGMCGGALANEGLSYSKALPMNVDGARAAGIEYVQISVNALGVDHYNNFIVLNNSPVALGNLQNGANTYLVSIDQFTANNVITINSAAIRGSWGTVAGYDDIEFWDLSVTWYP